MIRKNQAEELTKYNLWANTRIVQWLKSNNQKLATMSCKSSFSSILETINHICDGQIFYLSALKQRSIEKVRNNSPDGAFNGLISQSKEFSEYVKSQDMDMLGEFRFVNLKFFEGSLPQYELIQHCMNHSTYHRGQIITIGHQLGLNKAPSTDMLLYIIEREKLLTTSNKPN